MRSTELSTAVRLLYCVLSDLTSPWKLVTDFFSPLVYSEDSGLRLLLLLYIRGSHSNEPFFKFSVTYDQSRFTDSCLITQRWCRTLFDVLLQALRSSLHHFYSSWLMEHFRFSIIISDLLSATIHG